ncbi:hypothetical protein [Leptothermofonsia sp. ETS-13]|uniref:hypothetical protein n=1 Tax=Leptothermofonsia sp. ETS-13 TaxID=3035696 RepID=UPI003BA11D9D
MHKQIFPPILSLSLGITTLGSAIAFGLEARAEAEPIWHNCLTREVFTPQKQAWCDRWQILQTATYIVPTNLDPDPRYTKVSLNTDRPFFPLVRIGWLLVASFIWIYSDLGGGYDGSV